MALNQIIEDFEDTSYAFTFTGNAWIRTTSTPQQGAYCWTNNDIGDGGTTYSQFTVDIPADATNYTISFWYRVSSEASWDFLNCYVNGTRVVNVSGTIGWTQYNGALITGTNTIKFEYTKDGSQSSGSDAGFIDYIVVQYEQGLTASAADTLPLSDAISWDKSIIVTQDEPVNVSENISFSFPYSTTGFDFEIWGQGTFDVHAKNFTQAADDILALADSLTAKAKLQLSEALTLADSLNKKIKQVAADTAPLADSASPRALIQFTDAVSLADSMLALVSALQGDAASVVDVLKLKAKPDYDEAVLALLDSITLKAKPSISDTAYVVDALALKIGAVRADTLALADSLALEARTSLSDAVSLLDDIAKEVRIGNLNSALSLADSWVNKVSLSQGSDSTVVTDGIAALVKAKPGSDSTAISDALVKRIETQQNDLTALADAIRAAADSVNTDTAAPTDSVSMVAKKLLEDTVSLADVYSHEIGVHLLRSGTFGFGMWDSNSWDTVDGDYADVADSISIAKGLGVLADDLLALADAFTIKARPAANEDLNVVEGTSIKIQKPAGDTYYAVEGVDIRVEKQLEDIATLADALIRNTAKLLADTSSVSDELALLARVLLDTETLNLGDTLQLGQGRLLAESLSLGDASQLLMQTKREDLVTLAELLQKKVGLPPNEAQTVSDSIVAALNMARLAEDLLGTLDAASWKFKKILDEQIPALDPWRFNVDKAIAEAVAVAEALGIKTGKPLPADGVGLIDELYLKQALGIAAESLSVGNETIRGKVKTLLQQVFIGGVSVPVTGLRVRHSARSRVGTCSFNIPSPSVDVLNLAKQRAEVRVYLVDGTGNTDYFSGRIVGNPTRARSTITTEMSVTVDDWTAASQEVYVSEAYTDTDGSLTTILKDLWTKYYGYPINLNSVTATTKTVPLLPFNYDTLYDATEKIAQLLGWTWYVEWNGSERVLNFYSPDVAIQPITLSRENRNIAAGTASFGQDESIANVVYVFGGDGLSNPYTQKIVADGENTIYSLGAKPYRVGEGNDGGVTVTLVSADGLTRTPQTVGILNLHDPADYNVLLDFNSGALRWRDNNKPAKNIVIEAVYRYAYPITVQLRDDASIAQYGRIERIISDSKLKDATAARELGRAILRDYAYPKGYGSCEVFIPGLRAGWFITVDLPAYRASGLYEITEVEKWIQGSTVRRRVTLNVADDAESRIAERLREFAKRIANLEAAQRPEDMVVQRILQGPANLKISAVGKIAGFIDKQAGDSSSLSEVRVITLKMGAGGAKTQLHEDEVLADRFVAKVKLSKADTATAVDSGRIVNGSFQFGTLDATFGAAIWGKEVIF